MMPESLRLGTRGSALARTQSQGVADLITASTGCPVELVIITTRGDRIQDRPLPEIGGKGLFTLELETALLDGSIDFAVHSLKDLPTEDPDGLTLGAIPARVDPRDALVGHSVDSLPSEAKVGSGSLRRRMQLLNLRPDVQVSDIRGNVPTRIDKRDRGDFDATVLAMAGLIRLGVSREDIHPISVDDMVPAVGQGALAVQCRSNDPVVGPILAAIDDAATRASVEGERAFLRTWGGGCNVPAGAHISPDVGGYRIRAVVQDADGQMKRFSGQGEDPVALGLAAASALASATDA